MIVLFHMICDRTLVDLGERFFSRSSGKRSPTVLLHILHVFFYTGAQFSASFPNINTLARLTGNFIFVLSDCDIRRDVLKMVTGVAETVNSKYYVCVV